MNCAFDHEDTTASTDVLDVRFDDDPELPPDEPPSTVRATPRALTPCY